MLVSETTTTGTARARAFGSTASADYQEESTTTATVEEDPWNQLGYSISAGVTKSKNRQVLSFAETLYWSGLPEQSEVAPDTRLRGELYWRNPGPKSYPLRVRLPLLDREILFARTTSQARKYDSRTGVSLQSKSSGRFATTAVYGYVGQGVLGLDEVNRDIQDDADLFTDAGLPVDFDTFDRTIEFGGGFDAAVAQRISLGLELGHQSETVRHRYADNELAVARDISVAATDLSMALRFWPSSVFFLGGSLGVAFGALEYSWDLDDYNDPNNSTSGEFDSDSSGLLVAGFGGLQRSLGRLAVRFTAGYRQRTLGEMEDSSGVYVDNSGEPISFVFSGAYARLGLGIGLGR